MESLSENDQTGRAANSSTTLAAIQEKLSQPGREFYDAVANMIGLVALLNDHNTSEPDLINVRQYLSVEAGKLAILVKGIRGLKAVGELRI